MPKKVQKEYSIGGRIYTVQPLSFFDLFDFVDVIGAVMTDLTAAKSAADIRPADVLKSAKKEVVVILAKQLSIEPDDLRAIPADIGMEMIADFLEMTLTENFLSALGRAEKAATPILSSLRKG